MASTVRPTMRTRATAGIVLALGLAVGGCGDDDGDARDDTTAAASPGSATGPDDAATTGTDAAAPPAATPTAEELAAALLTVEQVDSRWTSTGPEPLQMDGVASRCPEGSAFSSPAAAVFVRFNPPEPLMNVIDQGLLTFDDPDDIGAWFEALESCAGTSWTEGSDPTEHVSAEASDMDDHGDARAAFVLEFAHEADAEPLHATRWYLVRLGHTLLVMSGDDTDLARDADDAFLEDVLERAVTKAESTLAT